MGERRLRCLVSVEDEGTKWEDLRYLSADTSLRVRRTVLHLGHSICQQTCCRSQFWICPLSKEELHMMRFFNDTNASDVEYHPYPATVRYAIMDYGCERLPATKLNGDPHLPAPATSTSRPVVSAKASSEKQRKFIVYPAVRAYMYTSHRIWT